MRAHRHGGVRLRAHRGGSTLVASTLATLLTLVTLAGVSLLVGFTPTRQVTDSSRGRAPAPARATSAVLLIPGWRDGPRQLEPLRRYLVDAGWTPARIGVMAFANPVGSNREHAAEIGAALEELKARGGAVRVDLVAHSMGGLAVRWYLDRSGADAVGKVVFLGTPHRGTYGAFLGWGAGAAEMRPGSRFLAELADSLPDGVAALSIRTLTDTRMIPPARGVLPGLRDMPLCCPTHAGMIADDDVLEQVVRFLTDPARTAPATTIP